MFRIQSILVPLDFSRHSEHALSYAIHLAGKLGANLQLLHCYGADMFRSVAYGPHYVPRIPPDFEDDVRKASGEKLAAYREQACAGHLHLHRDWEHRTQGAGQPSVRGQGE